MAFEKIATLRGRVEQLKLTQGNNQRVLSGEYNLVLDYLNSLMGEYSVLQVATGNSVTLDTRSGLITTASLTTAAGAVQAITLTNSLITATSNVIAWVETYSGTLTTNGLPAILRTLPAAGSANITVANLHGTNALSGTVTIKFIIL